MLYVDRRMGGEDLWYLHPPKDYAMRLPDGILASVCFIVAKDKDEADVYLGTGFFVRLQGQGIKHTYLVTAKHILPQATAERPIPPPIFARMWTRQYPAASVDIAINGKWEYAEDQGEDDISVDAGVIKFDNDQPRGFISEPAFTTDDIRQKYVIGIGDDLTVVGLFTAWPGEKGISPIVRSGIIAAIPSGPIFHSQTGQRYRAYLAELRSFGGLSGSPVLVHVGYSRKADGRPNEAGRYYLLGLIRSHWTYSGPADSPNEINMGIAAVTPWSEVMAILNKAALVKQRQSAEAEHARRSPFSLQED